MPRKSFTPKLLAKGPPIKQSKLGFTTGTPQVILPSKYNWFSLPAEVRNIIYELLFKASAKYKTSHGLLLLARHELSAQILRCCKTILNEARGMLYDLTFRINSDLPKFISSGGRHGTRNLLLRRIELDEACVNQIRMRELDRLTNLEVLVLAISIRGGTLPPDHENGDNGDNCSSSYAYQKYTMKPGRKSCWTLARAAGVMHHHNLAISAVCVRPSA